MNVNSADLLAAWNDKDKRQKMKEQLVATGNLQACDAVAKQLSRKSVTDTTKEKPVTKQMLKEMWHWDDTMIENTWKWAAQRGKVYRHPINQAEYIDIDVDSVREKQNYRASELETAACFATEDTSGSIFDPLETGAAADSSGSSGDPTVPGPIPAALAMPKGPVERVSFPAANPTVAAYQQLGQYIMILGQKIDLARDLKGKLDPHNATDEKAKELLGMRTTASSWFLVFSEGIAGPLGRLQELYKTMVNLQGDAMVTAPDRAQQQALGQHYVTCTKEDTMMSVWVIRDRKWKAPETEEQRVEKKKRQDEAKKRKISKKAEQDVKEEK